MIRWKHQKIVAVLPHFSDKFGSQDTFLQTNQESAVFYCIYLYFLTVINHKTSDRSD
uniref:Uncharacterized protein n=1 Tax=Arundo donax TaxID=35708 RepID=A0A0A9DST7_ARUDO